MSKLANQLKSKLTILDDERDAVMHCEYGASRWRCVAFE